MKTDPAVLRADRLREAREFYLQDDGSGFLDFIRDSGAAPDAEDVPHGVGAHWLFDWKGTPDPDNPAITNYLYKMMLWPRGSFKTQAFVIGYACWMVAKFPDIRILLASETGRQARKVLKSVMRILESKWFEEIFGVVKDPKAWSSNTGIISKQRKNRGLKDPTIQATGAGEVQTGAHFDLGLCDDIVSQENTATEDAIEKTNDWVGELLAQIDPGARLLLVGTRHHYADAYGSILKDAEKRSMFEFSIHEWKNPDGSLFFPRRITEQEVKKRKALLTPRLFACYYLNKPASVEEQIFLPEYFRTIKDEEIPGVVWTYILTDFAFKSLQKNDRTCFWIVSLDPNRVAYVRNVVVGRWKPGESLRILCRLWDDYQHVSMKGVTIEDTTHKELLQGMLEEIRRETFIRPKIIPIPGRSLETKNMRIEGIEPRFRAGDIYFADSFRRNTAAWREVTTEMEEWPFSQHDDIPDAISDIDKRDERDRYLLMAPPHGWRMQPRPSVKPTMVAKAAGAYSINPEKPLEESLWKTPQRQLGTDLYKPPHSRLGELFKKLS